MRFVFVLSSDSHRSDSAEIKVGNDDWRQEFHLRQTREMDEMNRCFSFGIGLIVWLIYCAEGACLDVEKLAVSNRVVGMINSTRVDLIRVKDGGGRFSRVVLIIPSPLPSSFSNFSYSSIFLPLQKLIFFIWRFFYAAGSRRQKTA